MKQFSAHLLTENSNVKKQFLRIIILLFFVTNIGTTANGQNPAVTINQAAAQSDPTSLQPINFTVVFDQPVTGFMTGDVVITGTASGNLVSLVVGGPITYNIAVSGMTSCGTVIANIPAGVCTNALSQPNLASTSIDNTVTYTSFLSTVNPVPNQQLCAGSATNPINFTSTPPGASFTWTNSAPSIGLPASGTGNIASFTAINLSATAVTATITVTPSNGVCPGTPLSFTITVNPKPVISITPAFGCGGVAGLYGGPLIATSAGGPTLSYVWSPLAGLYIDAAITAPYTGTNTPLVYAAPTTYTVYTVTGTNLATGCIGTATTAVNYTPPAPVITPASVNMCVGDPAVKLKVTSGGIPATPAAWSPISGLYSDALATIAYVGNAIDSVWVRPIPAGIYTYQVTTQGLPGPPISFTNPAPIIINAVGTATPYPVNLTVSGLPITGAVTVQSINITGFNHPWAGDVNIVLQSPTGQNVILMANSNADPLILATNVNLTFSDAASGSLPITSPMASGTYLPTNRNGATFAFLGPGPTVTGPTFPASPTLATFTGNMNGTWKLFVEDRVAGNQGSITGGFTINFNALLAPCTSPPRSVTVRVVNPVTISSHPANQALCPGSSTAVFSVSIAGSGPNIYQWQVSNNGGTNWNNTPNGGPYSGGGTQTLVINPVTAGMNGYLYRLLVNGGTSCSVTSNAGLLTINPLPTAVITANPLVIGPTQTTTIYSTVTANPAATYAWFYNNSVLPGAVADTLLVSYGSAGNYQLKVTNACGVGFSNIITIANSFAVNMYTYPNPSGGIFQVRYFSVPNNTLQRSLTVYNNWGEKIITKTFTQTVPYQKIDVDVRAYGKGIFWVELRDANGKRFALKRVVVQ